jgi:hypothetical protein
MKLNNINATPIRSLAKNCYNLKRAQMDDLLGTKIVK